LRSAVKWEPQELYFGPFYSVAGYKKKIVASLVAVALCSAAMVVCHAQSATAEPEKPLFDNSSPLFAKDPNLIMKQPKNLNTQDLFFKMMLAVMFVVVLGVAAIYISKKFLPKIANLPGREIRIVETVHLGPRKAVHLLKIGNQQLLIASTSESITKLADVTGMSKRNKGHLGPSDVLTNLSAQETDSN